MTPSRLHAPPKPCGALQSVVGRPPAISIFLSLPWAKNPMERLSGEQKGKAAPSVRGSACHLGESNEYNQRRGLPSETATVTRRCPSGAIASPGFVAVGRSVFSCGSNER